VIDQVCLDEGFFRRIGFGPAKAAPAALIPTPVFVRRTTTMTRMLSQKPVLARRAFERVSRRTMALIMRSAGSACQIPQWGMKRRNCGL
jgi:hypothetical protein